jgi:hypothetical protein
MPPRAGGCGNNGDKIASVATPDRGGAGPFRIRGYPMRSSRRPSDVPPEIDSPAGMTTFLSFARKATLTLNSERG